MESRHVLAIEPYYGGSHRAFLDGVVRHSRHRWTIVDGPAKHWKWRMRVAPLALARAACRAVENSVMPEAILCSDMLDVPAWLGLIQQFDSGSRWSEVPIATYFHENQWTYPQSPRARVDFHYGYTNLLSAIASSRCLFNSAFHRDSFLLSSESFVGRMPDCKLEHDFDSLREKCSVIPPGFDPPILPAVDANPADPMKLGWVSRWEHDKRPDRFAELLAILRDRGVEYRLVLLGQRGEECEALQKIRDQFKSQIIIDRFADTRQAYWRTLGQIDVVVSTADHEFFGIGICEAIWAGAAPVLPNRLSYPELVPAENRYDSASEAAAIIISMLDNAKRRSLADAARESIGGFQMQHTVPLLDEAIEQMVVRQHA